MNIASLLLGLGAWAVLAIGIAQKKKTVAAGFFLCAGALYLQILQTNILVNKPDWAAVEDTFPAVATAATVLVAVTLVLALVDLIKSRKK